MLSLCFTSSILPHFINHNPPKMTDQRQFKGIWIPVEILDDDRLSWTEIGLYAQINSLSKGGACTASNSYLADRLNISERSAKRHIKSLCEKGYLMVKIGEDNRSRFIETRTPEYTFEGGQNGPVGGQNDPRKGDKMAPYNISHKELDNTPPTPPSENDLTPLSLLKNTSYQTRLDELVSLYAKRGKEVDLLRGMSSAIEEKKNYDRISKNKQRIFEQFVRYLEDDLKFKEYKADKETLKRRNGAV